MPRTRSVLGGLALACAVGLAATTRATTVPAGFVHELVVGEPFRSAPVGFDFLPDGRIVLVELASGVVRLAAAGGASSDSIAAIPGVNANHPERGLLDVAVDPRWPARPYLYVQYTAADSTERVQRWTASGALSDPSATRLALGEPYLVLGGIPDRAGIHNGGTLRFAPDGTLLVSVGDDGTSCDAQDLDSPHGKLLRLDVSGLPDGGGGPPALESLSAATRPFPGPGWRGLVCAWGLRNPFRFDVDRSSGDVFIGNVGQSWYEEIDLLPATDPGRNFGWPRFEGPQALDCCGDCGAGNAFTFPIHSFPHPVGIVSILGGPVLDRAGTMPGAFPARYRGDYFYAEVFSGRIARLTRDGTRWEYAAPVPGQGAADAWAGGFAGITDLREGPDGSLWLVSLGLSPDALPRGVHRIRAVAPPRPAIPHPDFAEAALVVRPNPSRVRDPVDFVVETSGEGPVALALFDASGRFVRRFEVASGPGRRVLRWDGRAGGRAVPAGIYLVRMERGDTVVTTKLTRLR